MVDRREQSAYRFVITASGPDLNIMHFFARILQLLGLVWAGYGLFIGLYEQDIKTELTFAALGAVLFLIGWALQKRTGS